MPGLPVWAFLILTQYKYVNYTILTDYFVRYITKE